MSESHHLNKKISALWQLMRLEHGFMIAIAIIIGALIAGKGFPSAQKFLFSFLTALFLEAGTFALNDYFDLEVDMRNRRNDRPLVRGDLKPSTALYIYFIFLPAGLAASFMVNTTCFAIAVVNAFLSGVAREIMKDVMDFEGDAARKTKSFPTYVGKRGANIIAAIFYLVAVALSFIPFLFNIDDAYYLDKIYLSIVLLTDAMLVYTSFLILLTTDNKILNKCRKISLLGIFIGLIAFLAGAFA